MGSKYRVLRKGVRMVSTAVLGCGVIGSSWIQAFLAGGCSVTVWDPSPISITAVLQKYQGRVSVAETPEGAVASVDFIQESGPETLNDKRQLLASISEQVGDRTIVASSTSTLQPSELQNGLSFANRLVIGHPFNPPHIIPLVEVLGGTQTDSWAIDQAMTFYIALGKHPIRLHLERPGHLANRLQAALWREAVDAVASGQASVEDVDAAVKFALGPRWALTGPFETFHLGGGQGGLAHFLDHLGKPFETLWDDAQRPIVTEALKQSLVEAVTQSSGGRSVPELTAERNAKLKRILAIASERIRNVNELRQPARR